jgi:hypothetical protein
VQLPHSFSATGTPLSGITALQHLQLKHVTELDPTMMKHMTHLTHLELSMHKVRSSDLSELLDVLPALHRLHHLQLALGADGDREEYDAPVVERQQCGVFTSSSQLTSLQLRGMQLPDACGKELFPPGCKLPHLRMLKINGTGWKLPPSYGMYRHRPTSQPIGGSADNYSLMECCPNLRKLELAGAVQHGKSLSCLSHLLHLTALKLGGPTMDNICAAAVAEVTSLEQLTVIDPAPYKYKDADMLHGGSNVAVGAACNGAVLPLRTKAAALTSRGCAAS